MPDTLIAATTLTLPQPLWERVEETAKTKKREANQVVREALEHYFSSQATALPLSQEEEKAAAVEKILEEAARNRREFAKLVAEGKVHPPQEIPLEQVRKGLAGIKGSLSAEIIKEREEGW